MKNKKKLTKRKTKKHPLVDLIKQAYEKANGSNNRKKINIK